MGDRTALDDATEDERAALEEILPAGVTDDGKLTYHLVAEFEESA
ncbi:hypothetical protein [Haloterrigena salifodinae]|nr:hypothetical protein [Haloterrigena salifodinae]